METEARIQQALADANEGRSSHLQWAEHLEAHGDKGCSECAERPYKLDAQHEREWVAKYDNIIDLLSTLKAARVWHDQVAVVAKKMAFESGGVYCTPEAIGDFLLRLWQDYNAIKATMEAARGGKARGSGKDDDLVARLKSLAIRSHYYCEDNWYSCPKTEDGCSDGDAGTECNCGADRHNTKVEEVYAALACGNQSVSGQRG